MTKPNKNSLQQHGLKMMDKAVTARFGIACETRYNPQSKQFETAMDTQPEPAVLIFIAGYQKALADMFIAARL